MINKKDYALLSDDFLIEDSQNGNEQSFEILYKRYSNIGKKIAVFYLSTRGYKSYIIEEYLINLDLVFLTAYRSYDKKYGKFKSYYAVCLNNSIRRYIGRELLNNDLLKSCISLDTEMDGENLYGVIPDLREAEPNVFMQLQDIKLEICTPNKGIENNNENIQKKVIILKYLGYSNDEISKILSISKNKVSKISFKSFNKRKILN